MNPNGGTMPTRVNPAWIKQQLTILRETGKLDATTSYNPAIQSLMVHLTNNGKSFKLYNLGAGVKRLTTETDTCPCCKRKL
jgi:hypothetical protein